MRSGASIPTVRWPTRPTAKPVSRPRASAAASTSCASRRATSPRASPASTAPPTRLGAVRIRPWDGYRPPVDRAWEVLNPATGNLFRSALDALSLERVHEGRLRELWGYLRATVKHELGLGPVPPARPPGLRRTLQGEGRRNGRAWEFEERPGETRDERDRRYRRAQVGAHRARMRALRDAEVARDGREPALA